MTRPAPPLRRCRRLLLVLLALLFELTLRVFLPGVVLLWLAFRQGWWVSLLPGRDVASLDALHPELRPKVDAVIVELEEQGWEVRVSSAWRSARRQDALYVIGQVGERLGQAPWSRVRGGRSCHNQLAPDGSPGSAAVDLAPAGVVGLDQRAAFYRDLGSAAKRQGLRWGGDWGRSNAVWARYDIGWDPAHIEHRSLCLALRAEHPGS
jgi:hypothetical protein